MCIISIEGNIGSGKSTLIKYMKDNINKINNTEVIYLQEPVHIWESIKGDDGKNMIEKFYDNQEKYSFAFQMMAYISRLEIFKKSLEENPGKILITERSLLTDYNIFAKMLYNSKKLLTEEYEIYKKWFDYFNTIKITQILYIRTDPSISFERCIKRNRSGESSITLDYLNECHKMHEDWIIQEINQNNNVYIIDGNIDNTDEQYAHHLINITNLIQQKMNIISLANMMSVINNIVTEPISDPSDESTASLSIESSDESIENDSSEEHSDHGSESSISLERYPNYINEPEYKYNHLITNNINNILYQEYEIKTNADDLSIMILPTCSIL